MSPKTIREEIHQTRPFPSPADEASVALMRTADVVRHAIGQVVETRGVTLQQYNVLRIVRGAGEDGIPTLEIGERMIERMPGVTRLLDRLEAKGMVARERCPEDRRQVLCRSTPESLALLAELDDPVHQASVEAWGRLSKKEVQQILDLLARVREAAE